MKRIAIITGATGGLGKEFVKQLNSPELDEIWAISRNIEKLQALQKTYGDKLVVISKDLSNSEDIEMIAVRLSEEKPQVKWLINNAGTGKIGNYGEFTTNEVDNIISINSKTIAMLCTIVIPYMRKGSRILNISSQASFQPLPYLNLYAATKAFVTSYSRALNCELKDLGITVTAVCPGWVNTDLLIKEINGRKIKFPGIVEPEPVVKKAIKDAKCGKGMSVYGAYVKCMQLFSKIVPNKIVMKLWVKSIEKYE